MNISDVRNCYGCGVCATACTRDAIRIRLNSEGFLEPFLDQNKCTNCGICHDVCSYIHNSPATHFTPVSSYGSWSKDLSIRRRCSSGGVSLEVGRYLLAQGYKVCGVRYDVKRGRAEHYIASTFEELTQCIGSKYIQSYTVDGFKQINRKEKYLITGTPCQIDSFRRYIQKYRCENNFVLVDFFCHGVPSRILWHNYCNEVEKITGEITDVSWRSKTYGWHDSWDMNIHGKKSKSSVDRHNSYKLLEKTNFISSRWSQGDMFYHLFLNNNCLGRACYDKCKFKYDKSSADIRIGDAWGKIYENNEDGVSCTVAFTEKGDNLLRQANIECEQLPFEKIAGGQMKENPPYHKIKRKILLLLLKMGIHLRLIVSMSKIMNRIT